MSLRAGLIGYGLAGRFLHAPLIAAAGFEITAIVTRRAEARADFPGAAIVESAEALCARADVDLVIVVSPDNLHAAHARLALETGRHVVVDKPFTPTSVEALELIALAEARKRMLTVYQNRRWDADFLTVRRLIEEGTLGEIALYAARWDRYRLVARNDWHDQDMLGELYGLGPHLLDQVLTLFGAPDWLIADVYNQRGVAGLNDGFDILMGKGDLRISVGVNLLGADEARFHRVLGKKASFTKHGLDPQEAHLRARGPVGASEFGVEPESAWGVLTDGATRAETRVRTERGRWLSFYEGVRTAIETGATPPVDPRDAAQTIALLEAAMESSASGRRIDVAAFCAARGF